MNGNFVYLPRPQRRGRVIALHCSGGGASQWSLSGRGAGRTLRSGGTRALRRRRCRTLGGERVFTLADEAVRSIALIDSSRGDKVHLVGHSYGGGVALHVALARPNRIASMALYEPSAFHLLRQTGRARCGALRRDHRRRAGRLPRASSPATIGARSRRSSTIGTAPARWNALRPAVQSALIRWAPKAPLDFRALIDEPTPADAYRRLTFPVLILRGEHAPSPTRIDCRGPGGAAAGEPARDHRRCRPYGPADARRKCAT